jgi:ubiquinone/menaquinone biosynthesis C-methylase UbiE
MSATGQRAAPPPRNNDKGYKGLPMEGYLARWYARNTRRDLEEFRQAAEMVGAQVPKGGVVLEVAPGPGYLAIELARLGNCRVVGLDISHTFVEMATRNAGEAGLEIAFHHGDAAAMPFDDESFDFIVCRAAFKNFSRPLAALDEMCRVLRPGGKAVIIDLSKDASMTDIAAHVRTMRLSPLNAWLTKWIFKHMLLKRAYSQADFQRLARESRFGACQIHVDTIALEVWLTRPSRLAQ